jgi:hypothetical protein
MKNKHSKHARTINKKQKRGCVKNIKWINWSFESHTIQSSYEVVMILHNFEIHKLENFGEFEKFNTPWESWDLLSLWCYSYDKLKNIL